MTRPNTEPERFVPKGWLRNPHVQSVLASSGLRRFAFRDRISPLLASSKEELLDVGEAKLVAYLNLPAQAPRALVVLIHGWEGSVHSTYMLCLGSWLLARGFAVYRLNLRDHGDTHHLNEGIFHSNRLNEVVQAVKQMGQRFPNLPLVMGGYSLGGNFALRVTRAAPDAGIPVDYVFAVCPAIHPPHVLTALESGPSIYHDYFMRKWRQSLMLKQRHFPESYDFGWAIKSDMRHLTTGLVQRYTEYKSLDEYLNAYSIADDRLAGIKADGVILTSEDDPVCPVADFRSLQLPPQVELFIERFGGHCGFVRDFSLDSYAERFISLRLKARYPSQGDINSR